MLFILVPVLNTALDTVDGVGVDLHVVDDVLKGVVGVALTTHEHVNRHVLVFRPGVN